jgi:hypothetical protein
MIRTVDSFVNYVRARKVDERLVVESCILAMDLGLHMGRTVNLFQHAASQELGRSCPLSSVIGGCILAMEQGLLHVDAVNRNGETLGVYYVVETGHADFQSPSLWDKYWALGPDVATFWSALPADGMSWAVIDFDILINTPVLWEDVELVQTFAYKHPLIRKEVTRRRIRASLRFAWIAAVVLI